MNYRIKTTVVLFFSLTETSPLSIEEIQYGGLCSVVLVYLKLNARSITTSNAKPRTSNLSLRLAVHVDLKVSNVVEPDFAVKFYKKELSLFFGMLAFGGHKSTD